MPDAPSRDWLVRALTEAALVVFAVLLALAVDEWWDERENARLAVRTADAVGEELRRNREELRSKAPLGDVDAELAALDSAIAAYRDGQPTDARVDWDVALLSSAAWETAQLTRVTRHMELDRVLELAEVYELQRFFTRNQDEVASLIADMGGRMESEPLATLIRLRSRLEVVHAIRRTLSTVYACTLVEMEGPGAVEEGACPEAEGS